MSTKRKRTTRVTSGAGTVSAYVDEEFENAFENLVKHSESSSTDQEHAIKIEMSAMIKTLRSRLITLDTSDPKERLAQLYDRLERVEDVNRELQIMGDPSLRETAVRLPGSIDLGQGPATKHQKTFGGIRSVTAAHPHETLLAFIKENDPSNCTTIPMMLDCGLDEHSLSIMTPEDAVAYHIVLRTASYLLTMIDFKIVDSNNSLAYAQNYEIAIYILISYLLRKHPSTVNPAELGTDEAFVEALARITTKILVYTNMSSLEKQRAAKFIQDVCTARWESQANMVQHLLSMFASAGAMMQIVHCLVDAGDIQIRTPKWTDDTHHAMCFITQQFVPGDKIVELCFLPASHTDLEFKIPVCKELAAPIYGLFVWFNLPWILLRSNDFLVNSYTNWLCGFVAVLRFAEKNAVDYLYRTLDRLTRV